MKKTASILRKKKIHNLNNSDNSFKSQNQLNNSIKNKKIKNKIGLVLPQLKKVLKKKKKKKSGSDSNQLNDSQCINSFSEMLLKSKLNKTLQNNNLCNDRNLFFKKMSVNLSSLNDSIYKSKISMNSNHVNKLKINEFVFTQFEKIDSILTIFKINHKIFQNSISLIYEATNIRSNSKYFLKVYRKNKLKSVSELNLLEVT